jgi:hypothetical protein
MLDELVARTTADERDRTLSGGTADPERGWQAQAARTAGYVTAEIDLAGARRVAAAVIALLLRAS